MTPLQAAFAAIPDNAGLIGSRIKALMVGYDARWPHDSLRPLEVEVYREGPLQNPETGRDSRTFRLAGVLDLIAMQGTSLVICDHKTTSEDIADPASAYWRQLVIEGQLSHYMLLEWLGGSKVDYGVWDVVRKPQIAPRQITKSEMERLTFSGTWFGYRLPEAEIAAAQAAGRETPALYEARLCHDCIHERPNYYFQRRQIPRLDEEILEHARDLWDIGQDLVQVRQTGRHTRNPGACIGYSPCRFLGICSGHDSVDSANWKRKAQVHAELPIEGSDGRNLLTNSRRATFQTCRRKHELQYELGIERVSGEDQEALIFGTLWHQAQAAYFNTLKGQQHGINHAADSVNGIECGTTTNVSA